VDIVTLDRGGRKKKTGSLCIHHLQHVFPGTVWIKNASFLYSSNEHANSSEHGLLMDDMGKTVVIRTNPDIWYQKLIKKVRRCNKSSVTVEQLLPE
jgi:hypothetical protein